MQDLINEITRLRKELNYAIEVLKNRGYELAVAERNYRVALQKKILIERDKGIPVTIINDICRGDELIADLKMKRDELESLYDTADHKIQAVKLELRLVDNQLQAERKGE